MNPDTRPARRIARRPFVAGALALLAGACSQLLPERSAQTYYRFDDAAARPAQRAQPIRHDVVIAPISNNAVGNAYGMVYSRGGGERAFYQQNEWTDRPTLRVAQLLLERLDARHAFASVAQVGSGVGGDVLVNVIVDDVVHDLGGGGNGVGRVAMSLEIVERRQRRLLGRRAFVETAPAATANAAGAAAAINRALAAALDAASTWIESVVETTGN